MPVPRFRSRLAAVHLALGIAVVVSTAAPGVSGEPRRAPYRVAVHAVLVHDDDGSRGPSVTQTEVESLLDLASSVWVGALDFDLHSLVEISNTRINNDCTIVRLATGMWCSPELTAEAREAYALHPARDGKMVIFFRYGGTEFTCPPSGPCVNKPAGLAFSCSHCHYVVMGSDAPTGPSANLFAHEVGHYFWNNHTFGVRPGTAADAAEEIRKYIEDPNPDRPRSQGLNVFDGDGLSDTPPDPGDTLWSNEKGGACATGPGTDELDVEVGFSDETTQVYTLAPDRRNIMSYFEKCGGSLDPHHSSPQQRDIARQAVASLNRRPLTGKAPSYVGLRHPGYESTWGAGWAPGYRVIVPFRVGHQWHLLRYRANGKVDIARITNSEPIDGVGAVGIDKRWSGVWPTGITAGETFTLAGVPYVVVKGTGKDRVRIYRIRLTTGGQLQVTRMHRTTWHKSHRLLTAFSTSAGSAFVVRFVPGIFKNRIELLRVKRHGTGLIRVWSLQSSNVRATSGLPFSRGGKHYVALYDGHSGKARLWRVHGVKALKGAGTWFLPRALARFAAFDRGPEPRFLAYVTNAKPRRIDVYRVGSDLKPWRLRRVRHAPLSQLEIVRLKGTWSAITYREKQGAASLRPIIH